MTKKLKHIKQTGFTTPKNYLNELDSKLMQQINQDNIGVKEHGFTVPKNYFENLDDRILKATVNEPKTIKLINWKNITYVSGIAASLVLAFNVFFMNKTNVSFESLDNSAIESYIESDFDLNDLSYSLSDDDVTSEVFSEIDFSDSNMEDYLFQNATLSDFTTE